MKKNSIINLMILFFSFFLSVTGKSQDSSATISGVWFSCEKRNFYVGETISLKRDSCCINYEHNGNHFQIQVTFEFEKNYFSFYSETKILAVGSHYSYWELKNKNIIFIGHNENNIVEKYRILSLDANKLILLKMK